MVRGRPFCLVVTRSLKISVLLAIFLLGLDLLALPVMGQQSTVATNTISDPGNFALSTTLIRDTGETDTLYDYYAIRVTVDNLQYYPVSDVMVELNLPAYAEEIPPNSHQPVEGDYWGGAHDVTFSYQGISFSMTVGGGHTDPLWTGASSPSGRTRMIRWHQGTFCLQICYYPFWDLAEFALGFRVPQDAGAYAYVLMNALGYWFYWSFVSYSPPGGTGGGGGADNFNGNSRSGVADAPNSGTGPAPSCSYPCTVGGMLYGWTGDTTLDIYDRYSLWIPAGWNLFVRLYVNTKNYDLCLETAWKGTICSRNSGFTDELAEVINDSGTSQLITIQIETPQNEFGNYEMQYWLD